MSEKITNNHSNILTITLTFLGGIIGILLSIFNIKIPLFLDTTCTVLPFFTFGWWLNNHTNYLLNPFDARKDIPLLIFCTFVICFLSSPIDYSKNFISSHAIFTAHICGLLGTLLVLTIAKYVKKFPFISFWGRYSIMILCTHMLCILALKKGITTFNLSKMESFLIVFLFTMVICNFLIPIMKHYLPHVTAQKDILKIRLNDKIVI